MLFIEIWKPMPHGNIGIGHCRGKATKLPAPNQLLTAFAFGAGCKMPI